MDIPINVNVFCKEGLAGRITSVLINPVTDQFTHLVVRENHHPHAQYLAPVGFVASTTPEEIRLDCSLDTLQSLDPFIETDFIRVETPRVRADPYYAWPLVTSEDKTVLVEHERIPYGELAIRRGARVEATDGYVGKVDEFLVEPENTHITHLVLREGSLWAAKDISIPVSEIDHIEEDSVYLKLDKHSIGQLPTISLKRNRR